MNLHSQHQLTRDILYNRHGLSYAQIDNWLGKSEQRAGMDEKLREMARLAEFISINDAFSEAGLNFVSFKGPLLSNRLYGDATYRKYNDFDFLFDISSAEKANEILIKKGYSALFNNIPSRECQKKIFFRHIKEILLYNSQKDTNIEIHWNLFNGKFVTPNQIQQIVSANLYKITFAGRNFTVFNAEFELLYLVIHGGMHCFRRLKWLIDIRDYIENVPIDAEKFQLLTKQLNAFRLVALCNELLKIYFPASNLLPVKFNIKNYLLNYAIEKIESESYEDKRMLKEFIKGYRFLLSAFPGWQYKISIIKHVFFSTYINNAKTISCFPLAFILIVPFQKISRSFSKK